MLTNAAATVHPHYCGAKMASSLRLAPPGRIGAANAILPDAPTLSPRSLNNPLTNSYDRSRSTDCQGRRAAKDHALGASPATGRSDTTSSMMPNVLASSGDMYLSRSIAASIAPMSWPVCFT
jgi:hypothetical protein